MSEDFFGEYSTLKHASAEDLQVCVLNEVLLMLQEELEAMGTC